MEDLALATSAMRAFETEVLMALRKLLGSSKMALLVDWIRWNLER